MTTDTLASIADAGELTSGRMDRKAFEAWLEYGQKEGWVSDTYCAMHGEMMLSPEEQARVDDDPDSAFEDMDDDCIHVVRIFE